MKKLQTFLFYIVLILILTGCTEKDAEDYKSQPQPVALSDFLVGEGTYEKYTIKMILTEAEYFDIEHAIPGGGIFDENYSGSYVLQVFNENEAVSSFDLGKRNVGFNFEIHFADYNEDGNIDFTIGDWGGSSSAIFNIYSILDDDTIQDLGSIYTSEHEEGNRYSMLFDYNDKSISTQHYDMEKGDNVAVSYSWDSDMDKFLMD